MPFYFLNDDDVHDESGNGNDCHVNAHDYEPILSPHYFIYMSICSYFNYAT